MNYYSSRTYKKRQARWNRWLRKNRVHSAGSQQFSKRIELARIETRHKTGSYCWSVEENSMFTQMQIERAISKPNIRVPRSLRHLLPKPTTWALDSEWIACQNKRRQARKVSV